MISNGSFAYSVINGSNIPISFPIWIQDTLIALLTLPARALARTQDFTEK